MERSVRFGMKKGSRSVIVVRRILFEAVLFSAIGLTLACEAPQPKPDVGLGRSALTFLGSAVQKGPVGYRDPVGAPSPDGVWLALTEGRMVVVQPLGGGARVLLGPAPSQVRSIAWLPDSSHLAVHERSFDRSGQDWRVYDISSGGSALLWQDRVVAEGVPQVNDLFDLTWSLDGGVAGVVRTEQGTEVWTFSSQGEDAALVASGERLSLPSFSPDGRLSCLSRAGGVQFLHLPCGSEQRPLGETEVYGPVAFGPRGEALFFAAPNGSGVLELWRTHLDADLEEPSRRQRIASFSRDAYAPFVVSDGQVVFKTQDYRVFIASSPAEGGATVPLTSFQSETPSWSWDAEQVSFTFGGWRIATDDIQYPDIEQHIGLVDFAVDGLRSEPSRVLRKSTSEDQGMHFSPNGEWVVYHSHLDGTDDIYLMPNDGSAEPRQISFSGHETGWPRWSANGAWITFSSYNRDARGARKSHVYVIAVDQESGETDAPVIVPLRGFGEDALQAEWGSDGDALVFEAAEGAGKKAMYWVPREGGVPRQVHAWDSEQVFSGIAVSPDYQWAAFIGPAEDGWFQVFRVPLAGGAPEQLTYDPTHKTHPAYSPDGARVAFTVFSYQSLFFAVDQ